MTAFAWVLFGLGGGAAITDWVAVAGGRRAVERVAKPATLVALIAVTVALHPAHPTVRAAFLAGLVASLAGDLFLLDGDRWFVAGLASFLVGHLAYIVGFALEGRSARLSVVGLVLVAAGVVVVGRRIVGAVHHDHPDLAVPVVIYMGAISAMVVLAWCSARSAAIAGAMLFFVSDATLAWDRFVRPLGRGRLAVIVTYHVGQAGLVLALAGSLG